MNYVEKRRECRENGKMGRSKEDIKNGRLMERGMEGKWNERKGEYHERKRERKDRK